MITQDEIIRMAREAGLFNQTSPYHIDQIQVVERFAALVAAHERERQAEISAIPIIIETAVKESVLAEREVCANLVETTHATGLQSIREACAAAIRARGEK